MELRAARTAARAPGRDPGPVLLLAALVLAAELMPLELGRPGTRGSTTMSQPFAFALVLGWGTAAGLAGGDPGRAQVSLPAFAAAALAFFVANNLLVEAVLVEGEQALIRQLQEESDRLKRDLLATVSHELKTPLTVILGTQGIRLEELI